MSLGIQQVQAAYLKALRIGDETTARDIIARAGASGLHASDIYLQVFTPSMRTIGELWERNELSVAEEHLATAITDRLIGELSPTFDPTRAPSNAGTIVIGCVVGERHVLGARMLSDLFRQRSWRVLYIGADVPTDDWVELASRYGADLAAISAGMRIHVTAIRTLIERLHAALPHIQVLVGGAAFLRSDDLWRTIGADFYHADASAAVELATAAFQSTARHSTPPQA